MLLKITFNDIFKDKFLANFTTSLSKSTIIVTLLFAFIMSVVVFFVYKLTNKNVIYSKRFNVSMSLISIVTAAIILSMQANIAVSLGMVGALSIVRFRTAIKEPRDLLFLFWSISNGIVIGAGIYFIAVVLAIVLTFGLLFFDLIPDSKSPYLLVINLNKLNSEKIENILNKHKIRFKLKSQSLNVKEMSLIYELKLKDDKEFINEIVNLSEVEDVNLMHQDGECIF